MGLDTHVYQAARLAIDTALTSNVRFTDEDIDRYLGAYAEDFLCDYVGDFAFLTDLQRRWNPRVGLSKAQARGVLNCVLAEERRTKRPQAPQAAHPHPRGTYTVVDSNDNRRTLRFVEPADKGRAGNTYVKLLTGPDNEASYTYIGHIGRKGVFVPKNAVSDLVTRCVLFLIATDDAERATAGMAYALESGNCFRCGRRLTVPASIHRGLGPDCAARAA